MGDTSKSFTVDTGFRTGVINGKVVGTQLEVNLEELNNTVMEVVHQNSLMARNSSLVDHVATTNSPKSEIFTDIARTQITVNGIVAKNINELEAAMHVSDNVLNENNDLDNDGVADFVDIDTNYDGIPDERVYTGGVYWAQGAYCLI